MRLQMMKNAYIFKPEMLSEGQKNFYIRSSLHKYFTKIKKIVVS